MFEKTLSDKLKTIFDFKKASFDHSSVSQEQECLFIEVHTSVNRVKDGKFIAKVTGQITVYCNNDKLPYGYFTKKIAEAPAAASKDLFFYDIEGNKSTFQNITERTMSFIYLFECQYNPEIGDLTSVVDQINFVGS